MAGAKNRANVRMYGDDDDAVYVGPKGIVFPLAGGPALASQIHIGWLGEDGIGFDQDITTNSVNGLQGGARLRNKRSAVERSFTFQAMEETATTMGLYYPGITSVTDAAGITTFTVPAGARSDERSWMVDSWDDDIWKRHLIPVGEVTETGTISHTNSGATILEFTVAILGTFDIQSNNPAYAATGV